MTSGFGRRRRAPGFFWCLGNPWALRNISVAGNGHIFASVNQYVREYSPTGAYLGSFGGDALGDVVEGVASDYTGNKVWVTVEQNASNAQRWDRDAAGDWHRAMTVGSLNAGDTSDCLAGADDHRLANPYDVNLDGAGNIYVMDTTCMRIRKYSSSGIWRTDIWRNYNNGGPLYHGFAVNWLGNVLELVNLRQVSKHGLKACSAWIRDSMLRAGGDRRVPRGRPSLTYQGLFTASTSPPVSSFDSDSLP